GRRRAGIRRLPGRPLRDHGDHAMSDLMLSPVVRRVVGGLRLPVPMPARLRRDGGAWAERSLSGRITVVGSGTTAECLVAIAAGLAPAGAAPYLAVPEALRSAYRIPEAKRPLQVQGAPPKEPGEAKSRSAPALDALGEVARIDALVFDATGIGDVASLRSL